MAPIMAHTFPASLVVPTPTLAALNWVNALLIVAFLFVSVMMILVILIQRPQGGGLSGAFGSGAGSGQTAFGARTGDALTIATIGIFVLFVLSAAGLNFALRPGKSVAAEPAISAPAGGAEQPAPETPSSPAGTPGAPVGNTDQPAPVGTPGTPGTPGSPGSPGTPEQSAGQTGAPTPANQPATTPAPAPAQSSGQSGEQTPPKP